MFANEFDDIEEIKNNEDTAADDAPQKSPKGKKGKPEKEEPVSEESTPVVPEEKAEPALDIPDDNGLQLGAGTNDGTVTVQPVKFASFDNLDQIAGEENKNLDILMDVKLQLNVELGRCELPIKKVLELTRGSIIELDKVAGEPVELYANGKLIAHGEVVVIDDNFGLRITNITEPDDRIN